MTEFQEFIESVRAEATRTGLFVWEDVPSGMPVVEMPDGSTASDLCGAAVRIGTGTVYVYLDDEEDAEVAIAGFAKDGVYHRLLRLSPNLSAGPAAEDDDDDEDDDEDDSPWTPFGFGQPVTYEDLTSELQALVDAVVENEDYDPTDPEWEMEVLIEVCGDIDEDDFERVKEVAEDRFQQTRDRKMGSTSVRIATNLAKDPAFDPLLDADELVEWIAEKKPGTESRVVRRVVPALRHIAHTTGLWEAAAEALAEQATEILDAMQPAVRDRLGFATRVAVREEILEPYLKQYSEARQWRLGHLIVNIEEERDGQRRQRRYASAASRLMKDHKETKAATGRILGLSTGVIDRLLRDYPKRIDIRDDEVLTDLDPRLAGK